MSDEPAQGEWQPVDVIYSWAQRNFGVELPQSGVKFLASRELERDLTQRGFSIIKVGEVPPWMEEAEVNYDGLQGWSTVDGERAGAIRVFRLSPASPVSEDRD